jgi:3,4-dihydroxy 2-butanone 4-phosphate synthase / GTP cyclohydrolase II
VAVEVAAYSTVDVITSTQPIARIKTRQSDLVANANTRDSVSISYHHCSYLRAMTSVTMVHMKATRHGDRSAEAWTRSAGVAYQRRPRQRELELEMVEIELPTSHGLATCVAFRRHCGGPEHIALGWGPIQDGALVRIHSECATGDLFGSLRCDCGPQLEASKALISAEGGVLLYLRGHEGRGIGLFEKIRAYERQVLYSEDTVESNIALGWPVDARDYSDAAAFLLMKGVRSVRLITNNPDKCEAMERYGLAVDRVQLHVAIPTQAASYVRVKQERMGHMHA